MSRDFHNICNKVLQSNQELHSGPNVLIKELDSVRKEIKILSNKIDQIYKLIIDLRNQDNY